MIMTWLAKWAATMIGRLSIVGGSAAVLVSLYAWNNAHQRAVGGDKRQAKIEKATDNARAKGKRAAAASAAAGVRGQRDPTTRND